MLRSDGNFTRRETLIALAEGIQRAAFDERFPRLLVEISH